MKENYSYFENRNCEYFPCHKCSDEYFNCMFCYCPLYTLGSKCGGDFVYTKDGTKDCSHCMLPHSPEGYDYINSKFSELKNITDKNFKE